jgi:hypothetical protein
MPSGALPLWSPPEVMLDRRSSGRPSERVLVYGLRLFSGPSDPEEGCEICRGQAVVSTYAMVITPLEIRQGSRVEPGIRNDQEL